MVPEPIFKKLLAERGKLIEILKEKDAALAKLKDGGGDSKKLEEALAEAEKKHKADLKDLEEKVAKSELLIEQLHAKLNYSVAHGGHSGYPTLSQVIGGCSRQRQVGAYDQPAYVNAASPIAPGYLTTPIQTMGPQYAAMGQNAPHYPVVGGGVTATRYGSNYGVNHGLPMPYAGTPVVGSSQLY